MRKSLLFLVAVITISAFAQVFAQEPERKGPPPVLYIVREDIKPSLMAAHNKHSASFASIFKTLGTPNYRIALVPVAGSENEVIYVTGCESFKKLEDILNETDKKIAGAGGNTKAELDRLDKEAPLLHAAMRDLFANYRADLSFNPGVDIRTMRYFQINTVRVRPGHDAQYVEYLQKIVNPARQKAKLDALHIAAFQVITGTQNGTYMFFRPMKSLAELDVAMAMKTRAAMGDDTKKDADKAASEAIMSSETSTYVYAPNMSYVEKDFAAGDPAFWNTKPTMMAKPKSRKKMAKPLAPPPPTD
jgi:hypothetical protein